MFGKIVGICFAFLLREVRGEFDLSQLHENFHLDHMNTAVWDHAENFTNTHMEGWIAQHRDQMEEVVKNGHFEKEDDVKCDHCKCKKCAMIGAKKIMKMVWGGIKKWCWSGEKELEGHGDMKKYFCMAAKKHPMVMTGFLMYHVRPGMTAYTWCMGAGYCKHHHTMKDHFLNMTETELSDEDNAYIEPQIHHEFLSHMNIRGGQCHHHGHHEELMNEVSKSLRGDSVQMASAETMMSDSGIVSVLSRRLSSLFDGDSMVKKGKNWFKNKKDKEVSDMKEFNSVIDEMGALPHMKGMDPHCFVKVMKVVMGMAIKHTIMMCKKTECSVLKKMCMFAGKHKALAFGAMLAHVQPHKFAIGRCWGRGIDTDPKLMMMKHSMTMMSDDHPHHHHHHHDHDDDHDHHHPHHFMESVREFMEHFFDHQED